MWLYMYAYMNLYTGTHRSAYMCARVFVCVSMYIDICVYMCTHIHSALSVLHLEQECPTGHHTMQVHKYRKKVWFTRGLPEPFNP